MVKIKTEMIYNKKDIIGMIFVLRDSAETKFFLNFVEISCHIGSTSALIAKLCIRKADGSDTKAELYVWVRVKIFLKGVT